MALKTISALAGLMLTVATAPAQIITLDFGLDTNSSLTPAQRSIFQAAADDLNSIIVGYKPGITRPGLAVDIDDSLPTDGAGGERSSTGPTGAELQGGYWIANGGIMEYDPVDVATLELDGSGARNGLYQLVFQGLFHVVGFGTLWELNNVYDEVGAPGEYTGLAGLDAYRNEFVGQSSAGFVPVEMAGALGFAHGHWDEDYTEPSGPPNLTGIVDQYGRDLADELNTGWAGPGSNSEQWLSETSALSLEDIGFLVEYIAVPEPGVLVLMNLAALGLAFRNRRRLMLPSRSGIPRNRLAPSGDRAEIRRSAG